MADKAVKLIEYIPGGMADGMTLEDIAKKHGVDISVINKGLKAGIEVEHEHSPDDNIAAEISKDHLTETPFYYEYLAKMEEEFKEHYKEDLKRGGMEKEDKDAKVTDSDKSAVLKRLFG